MGNLPNRKTFPTNMTHVLHNKERPVSNTLTSEPAQGVFVDFTVDTPPIHNIILRAYEYSMTELVILTCLFVDSYYLGSSFIIRKNLMCIPYRI